MNAVWVLTLVFPNDLEGHFAEVDAVVTVGLMVGARSTSDSNRLSTRVMAMIVSLESAPAHG